MNPLTNNTSPISGNPALNPGFAGTNPLVAGAQERMGGIDDFLKGKGTPDANAIMDMLKKIMELLQMLLQQQKGEKGAEAAGGAAKSGGGEGGAKGGSKAGGAEKSEKVDGPNGFLWKPKSESDGNLVVLLPPNLKGKVDSVSIKDANGNTVGTGKFSGDAKNGGRPHFRFDKPGAAYGNNLTVEAKTSDGRTVTFPINSGAARND